MKLAVKTGGWMVVSGVIFMGSALLGGTSLKAAFIATSIAMATKTPAYTLFEWFLEKIFGKEVVCCCGKCKLEG